MNQREQDMERLKEATEKLLEFFDNVQVFATRYDGKDGTVSAKYGGGNWFARYGQVREWLIKEDESARVEVRPDNPPDENWKSP